MSALPSPTVTAASDVCAIVSGTAPASLAAEVIDAVAGQSAVPNAILRVSRSEAGRTGCSDARMQIVPVAAGEGELAAAVAAARARDEAWIWFVDSWTVPAPDTLAELLAVARSRPTEGSAPVLLASRVLDVAGRLHPDATPRHEVFEKQRTVDAAQHHLVHLRTARAGSVLVAGAFLRRHDGPRSDLAAGSDMLEWSVRLLRRWEDPGYLVPSSVAVRRAQPRPPSLRRWATSARVAASPGWSPVERLWEVFQLGESLPEALRGGRTVPG